MTTDTIDLAGAIKAGRDGIRAALDGHDDLLLVEYSLAAVTAALPHIEHQVRERLHHHLRSWPASQMRGVEQDRSQDYYDGVADALYWAAGVARGEQP